MALDETTFRPGDPEAVILRKILQTLQNSGGGTGPASNVAIADGADVAEGSRADVKVTNPDATGTVVAILKGILQAVNVPATGSTSLTTIDNSLTTIDNSLATVDSSIQTTNSTLNTISGKVDVQLSSLQNVGGFTSLLKDTTAVSTSIYAAGDAVGGKRTLTNALRTSGGTGILESITILDRANQKAAMELFIFDSDPSAATITDNSAFVFSTDDLKVLAHITIADTDYVTINSKAMATLKGIGITLKGSGTANLYAALVTTGTPTYAATTDVQLIYGILQD